MNIYIANNQYRKSLPSKWIGSVVAKVILFIICVALFSCDIMSSPNGESAKTKSLEPLPNNNVIDPPDNVRGDGGNASNTIRWDNSEGATAYNLYWSTIRGTGMAGGKIPNVQEPYTHIGLAPNSPYYYVMTLINAEGKESVPSTEVGLTTHNARFSGDPNAELNFDTLDSKTRKPIGIWSDEVTMWVLDFWHTELHAYNFATQDIDTTKSFALTEENTEPAALWSDGTTMWVSDYADAKIYAYNLATKKRDIANEFILTEENTDPRGIWSDGKTIWIGDRGKAKLYAYNITTHTRDSTRDFTLDADHVYLAGLWSDGKTMWVVGNIASVAKQLYAYNLEDGTRDAGKDVLTTANLTIRGIWSDGETMWVSDVSTPPKLYAYDLYDYTQEGQ